MTDIVERLYEMADDITYELAAQEITRLRAEIAMLRADLLKAEMKAELDDLEDVGRLVAIGRREGIEAALKIVQQWPPHMVVANLRALLEEPGRD